MKLPRCCQMVLLFFMLSHIEAWMPVDRSFQPPTTAHQRTTTASFMHENNENINHNNPHENAFSNVSYRSAIPQDEFTIRSKQFWRNGWIPMDYREFVVAVTTTNTNPVVGWVQISSCGPATVDPTQYNAAPGSQSVRANPQQDNDDQVDDDEQAWLEFEQDTTSIPTGWASLPWTQEYRAMEQAARARNDNRVSLSPRQRQERQRQKQKSNIYQLQNWYVEKEYRGRGVGQTLVERALERHFLKHADAVYVRVSDRHLKWFTQQFDFEVLSDSQVPVPLQPKRWGGNGRESQFLYLTRNRYHHAIFQETKNKEESQI